MAPLISHLQNIQAKLESLGFLSFISPLLFRLFLGWVFFWAGYTKFANPEGTALFFASLGFPLPTLMTWLVIIVELIGGIALVLGFAVRWWAVPLIFTMVVAAVAVHWDNGWYAIAQSRFDEGVQCRVDRINEMIQACGNPDWVLDSGRYRVALLQGGIEFAATYLLMLLSLFFTGAGKLSVDTLIRRHFSDSKTQES